MINKFFSLLYSKLFVNIVFDGKNNNVYIELRSNGKKSKLLKNIHRVYDNDDLSTKMMKFIESYTSQTPYFYISILDFSSDQGAVPTCDVSRSSLFHEMIECEHRCVEQKWSYYTQKSYLISLHKSYQKIGLDFIFSPFAILLHFFKDKIETNFAMFVLVQANQMTLAVFSEGSLLFAKNRDMKFISDENELVDSYMDEDMELDLELDLEDGIELDEIDVDSEEMELIDDFGDIEDLDLLEDIDEFSDQEDVQDILEDVPIKNKTALVFQDSFNRDYERFKVVHAAIAEYYNDKRYESRFIEDIYVADSVSMDSEFKRYLEEELFVRAYVRRIEVVVELCELAKMELYS